MNTLDKRRQNHERHVLAAIGQGGSFSEVEPRISKRLTHRDIYEAVRRLEDGGAITRGENGHMTRDIQAWAEMRRNRT